MVRAKAAVAMVMEANEREGKKRNYPVERWR